MIFLPGGYPELYAETLAASANFKASVRAAAARGAWVYGECGGYMWLGDGLIDARGTVPEMLRCMPLNTSFCQLNLDLRYRHVRITPG